MRGKTLLIIGAGREQVPGIELAKKLGLHVVVTDGNAQAPGFAYADAGATVDTYDARGQASFAKAYNKKRKIDGVMTLASDIPHIVSFVARALNLPAHPLSTAKRASDKLLMKRAFARHGVPIPFFKEIKSVSGLERFAGRHGYPVVVKPADSRGARGVCIVAEGGASLRRALASARAESPSKRVMVETFLPGPQLSTESVVYRGRIVCTVVAERNYGGFLINPPYAIEDGGETPADLSAAQRRAVDLVLTRAARAMGITDGSMKGDLVYTAAGPKIIEVAARLSGGYYATDTIPLATGVDMVEAVMRICLGLPLQPLALHPKRRQYVSQRYFFPPKAGKVKAIRGIVRARSLPGVVRFFFYAKKGDTMRSLVSHPARLGCVLAVGRTKAQAVARAKNAISLVKIQVG